MSNRSCYYDDVDDPRNFAMWRGQVASSIRGRRGQAFLRELVGALDAMPEKRLIANTLRKDGEVCALGCVGAKRGLALETLDPYDYSTLAGKFGIAEPLVRELEFVNDDPWEYREVTPERRWQIVRGWAASQIKG